MNAPAETRTRLLEETATHTGDTWCADWLRELASRGRVAEGGWPGTVTEARGLVSLTLRDALVANRFAFATEEELRSATVMTYAAARKRWHVGVARARTVRPPQLQGT